MVKRELIGGEDIEFGSGTFTRTGKSGASISINKLHKGWVPGNLLSKTANYSIGENDDIIGADTSGGAFTLTFPTDTAYDFKVYKVIMIGTGSNILTLSGTFNGLTNLSMMNQYSTITVLKNGTSYYILNSEGLVW